MGLTKVTVQITNLEGKKPGYEALFLVDTGAIHCMAPANELKKAGVKVKGKKVYELANGTPYEVEYGYAIISFMGDETVTPVIFGPDNVEPILGVLALESTGIGVDPVTTTLKRMPAISLKTLKNQKNIILQKVII